MPATAPKSLGDDSVLALTWSILSAWAVCALALVSGWARGWLFSGCAVETILLLFGPSLQSIVPPSALALCLNAVYAISSTSWLLHIVFTTACWPLVVGTSIAQYVLISSFARGRLRSLLHKMHFYRDKVAFFDFPVLIIDTGISGFVAVHGVTASLLTLSIEFHSVNLGLNIGQGHEVHAHTDSVEIKLFRRIKIGEIYAAHKCLEDEKEPDIQVDDDSCQPQQEADGPDESQVAEDIINHETNGPDESRIVEDNIRHEATVVQHNGNETAADVKAPASNASKTRVHTVFGDEDAELRYSDTLKNIRTSGGLYQKRERLRNTHGDGEYTEAELIELRAMLCTELRKIGLSLPENAEKFTTTQLDALFPEPNVFEHVPSAMRALLRLASHTHPIECPSISVTASGKWLNDLLSQVIFRRHPTDDQRIRELEREVSEWLSVGEYCVDLANITALGQVPLRSMYNIKSEIRSTGIVVSRVDVETNSSSQMISLAGADGTFVIPTCLLPNHSHLVPPEPSPVEVAVAKEKRREDKKAENNTSETSPNTTKSDSKSIKQRTSEDEAEAEAEAEEEVDLDALGVFMSIRATLPAHLDETCLSFAATLSKAAQMMDIEETIVDPPTPMPYDENLNPTDSFREKFSRRSKQLESVMKHPLQTANGAFHREMRKATVMRVNGAWFAKWTNKILEQLAWLNGDMGYTFEIPVSLKPYR